MEEWREKEERVNKGGSREGRRRGEERKIKGKIETPREYLDNRRVNGMLYLLVII